MQSAYTKVFDMYGQMSLDLNRQRKFNILVFFICSSFLSLSIKYTWRSFVSQKIVVLATKLKFWLRWRNQNILQIFRYIRYDRIYLIGIFKHNITILINVNYERLELLTSGAMIIMALEYEIWHQHSVLDGFIFLVRCIDL